MDAHPIFDGFHTQIVGRPVGYSATNASPGQPHAEACGVMVSSLVPLSGRRSSKLSTPDNESFVKQPSRFQVANQCSNRLITFQRISSMIHNIAMSIPGLTAAVIQLDHANPSLHKSPSDQTSVSEFTTAILSPSRFRFATDVKGFLSLRLHAVGNFQRLNPGLELQILWTLLKMLLIHSLHQIQQTALRRTTYRRIL